MTIIATDWLSTLHDQLGRARHLLGEKGAAPAEGAERANQALRQASDALMAGLSELGVATPRGWRLHQLRSRLDAHLLAASALADADAQDGVVDVLRRSLTLIERELDDLAPGPQQRRQPFSTL